MRLRPLHLVIAAALSLLAAGARADEPRRSDSFRSASGAFELKLGPDRKAWSLLPKGNGKPRYTITAEHLESQTVFVSDDGRSVIALNDWPELGPDATSEPWGSSYFLQFFRDGALLKAFRERDLVRNACALSYSVSHATWLLRPSPKEFPASVLELTTQDLTTFRFDERSGAMLAREVPAGLERAEFVYGELQKPKDGLRELKVVTVINGRAAPGDVIAFEVDESDPAARDLGPSRYAVVILEGGKLSPLTRRLLADPVHGVYSAPIFNLGTACR
jgi:hypothetical protein